MFLVLIPNSSLLIKHLPYNISDSESTGELRVPSRTSSLIKFSVQEAYISGYWSYPGSSPVTASDSHSGSPTSLTQGANSSPNSGTFDVVISIYKENATILAQEIEEMRQLPQMAQYKDTRVFVYTKDLEANITELKEILNTTHVFHLPNRGREAGAFLTHILNNWNDLGAHVFFRQAELHHYGAAMRRLKEFLVPPSPRGGESSGMFSLGWFDKCRCGECQDMSIGSRTWWRIPELYTLMYEEMCPEEVVITYLGQIVVSRKRIRAHPKKNYQHILDVLQSEMDHWIHKDPRPEKDFPDTLAEPFFGHTMERAWMILFGCADVNILKTCGTGIGSLLDGRRHDDAITRCQCMDKDVTGEEDSLW